MHDDKFIKKLYNCVFYKYKYKFMFCLLLMLLSTGVNVLIADIFMVSINKITDGIFKEAVIFLIIYLLFSILQSSLTAYLTYYNTKITNKISVNIKNRILNIVLNEKGDKLFKTDSSEYTSLMLNDSYKVSGLINDIVFPSSLGILKVIGMIVFLAIIEWKLLIIVVIVQPIMYFLQNIMKEKMKYTSNELRENYVGFIEAIKEYTSNLFQVITMGINEYFKKSFNLKLEKQNQSELKIKLITSINEIILDLVTLIPMVLLLIVGGYEVSIGKLTVGALLLYIQYYGNLFSPFQEIYEAIFQYESYKPSIRKVLDLLEKEEIDNNHYKNISGNLEINNLSFAYTENKYVLKNINAKFEFGKVYGIYGESGCGKSTLSKLILGFWHIENGSISIGGININDIDKTILRKYITYISQDSYLLNDSIYENIVFNKECSKEKFNDILNKVNLYDTVQKLPMKEKTIVGDKGAMLSGGQRKRITLARALLKKTPIIILDEPTSELDDENSINIMKQLINDFSKSILIIISHQKEIINLCDVKYEIKDNKMTLVKNFQDNIIIEGENDEKATNNSNN